MPKEIFVCCGCGQKVAKYRSQLTNVDLVFCSLLCRNKNFQHANPDWRPSNYLGPVERICEFCDKSYSVERRNLNSGIHFCSIECSAASRVNHKPFEMTNEIKDKLSKAQMNYCKTSGNQFVTGKSKGKHSDSTKIKISKANVGKPPHWKGRVFEYNGKQGSFKVRSSYELFFANWLDKNNIPWKYEPIYFLSDGRAFSPDFQLMDGTIIEVKGFWTSTGKCKWEMFCKEFPMIKKQVLIKDDLIKLGMNTK